MIRPNEIETRKLLRMRLGLSQTEAAKIFRVSRQFYQLWETGKKTSAPLAEKLITYYSRHCAGKRRAA